MPLFLSERTKFSRHNDQNEDSRRMRFGVIHSSG